MSKRTVSLRSYLETIFKVASEDGQPSDPKGKCIGAFFWRQPVGTDMIDFDTFEKLLCDYLSTCLNLPIEQYKFKTRSGNYNRLHYKIVGQAFQINYTVGQALLIVEIYEIPFNKY